MTIVPLLLSGVLLLAAVPASAQAVMSRFDQLSRVIEPGDWIEVTSPSGATIKGTLAALSPSALDLRVARDPVAATQRVLDRDVATIVRRRRDSLWNGMLIGVAASGSVGEVLISCASAPRPSLIN
jgi:hypothetical protein